MKTVILCGGYGTRIRDVADDIPKPMIPIGPYPILWHVMKGYAHHSFADFVLCLGYKGQSIKSFFLNYEAFTNDFSITLGAQAPKISFQSSHSESGWKVTLAETGPKTMTGGRVRRIKKYVEMDDRFFLTYGDGVGDVDIRALLAFHKSHGKVLTVTGVRPPGRFGELEHDANFLATEFNEKPRASGSRISGGFFVCEKKIFEYLEGIEDDGDDLVLEQEPFARLVRDQQMTVYCHDGFWHPMDTYRDYAYLNGIFDRGEAPWTVWQPSKSRGAGA